MLPGRAPGPSMVCQLCAWHFHLGLWLLPQRPPVTTQEDKGGTDNVRLPVFLSANNSPISFSTMTAGR